MVETYHIAPAAQGAASLKLKIHRPSWAVVGDAEVRGAAYGDVRRAVVLFIAEMARPGASFDWCSFVDCFIHENGNCGAVVMARRRAHDSAEGAEPMCALPWRQSLLHGEGTPRGRRPRQAFWLEASRGGAGVRQYLAAFSPVKGPSRGKKPSRGSPGLESLVLS